MDINPAKWGVYYSAKLAVNEDRPASLEHGRDDHSISDPDTTYRTREDT
jgi:hypothetical protein